MSTPEQDARENLKGLLTLLPIYIGMLEIEHPDADLELAVIAKNSDGSGKVGPSWEIGSFMEDLTLLVGATEPTPQAAPCECCPPVVPRTPLSDEDMEAVDALVHWRSDTSDWYGEDLVDLVSLIL